MTFGEALEQMKLGKSITRNKPYPILRIYVVPRTRIWMSISGEFRGTIEEGKYHLTSEDLLADDWIVVE